MITPDKSVRIDRYTMSGELFTRGFQKDGGPCSCSSACCEGGVYVDLHERDVILAHRDLITRHMDRTQTTDPSRWFEAEVVDDPDFPSGQCVGTDVVNNKCAFLDGAGRCSLQKAALAEGKHRWSIKPLFCILYPIVISGDTVSFDEMLQDEESCCTIGTSFDVPLFEACREELVHLVGEEGYASMEQHYASLRNEALKS
jgi:Fe-S-cluster containining protein